MTPVWPWLAAVGLGLFHGLNPGMGWLFAVSNGLQAGRARAIWAALLPIGAGHFLAMAIVLLPAAVLASLSVERPALQIAAALALIGFGGYKLARPRHPRFVARVGPRRLLLWSFLMASAHGAGLMLLPVYFAAAPAAAPHHGHGAVMSAGGTPAALLMVVLHTFAMLAAAGGVAWLVYRYLGLALLRATWLNTDRLWAFALIAVGALALPV